MSKNRVIFDMGRDMGRDRPISFETIKVPPEIVVWLEQIKELKRMVVWRMFTANMEPNVGDRRR